jgi:hypothetical protein
VGPRAGLDDVYKRKFLILPGLEIRTLRRPARSQSLYRLSYPGSLFISGIKRNKEYTNYIVSYPKGTGGSFPGGIAAGA